MIAAGGCWKSTHHEAGAELDRSRLAETYAVVLLVDVAAAPITREFVTATAAFV
jgi:hypothetical protein